MKRFFSNKNGKLEAPMLWELRARVYTNCHRWECRVELVSLDGTEYGAVRVDVAGRTGIELYAELRTRGFEKEQIICDPKVSRSGELKYQNRQLISLTRFERPPGTG